MKKPIEEMFLYKLNYYVCRIFLTSLISNALFALVLGCLFTLGLVLSARVVYLIYFLMMYPSYYLSVHYLAEKNGMLEERENQTDVFHHYVVSAVCHYFCS